MSYHLPNLSRTEDPPDHSGLPPSAITDQPTGPDITCVLAPTLPCATESASRRTPMVIKGSRKRTALPPLSPGARRARRLRETLLSLLVLALVLSLAFCFAVPLSHDLQLSNPLRQPGSSFAVNQSSGQMSIVQQATATAVSHQQNDGYGGGAAQLDGNGSGSLNWWKGECTYWANYRYHYLAHYWVSWTGDADQWVVGARAAGWNVAFSPPTNVPSIIVLMPGIQGASGLGHVAVVENIVAGVTPLTVHTSNMNWYANGGGFDIVSYYDFHVDPGHVFFIWHK